MSKNQNLQITYDEYLVRLRYQSLIYQKRLRERQGKLFASIYKSEPKLPERIRELLKKGFRYTGGDSRKYHDNYMMQYLKQFIKDDD